MSKPKVTGFLSVFEAKLDKLLGKIKAEYEKPKAERNKSSLKDMAKEAKKMRKLVNELKAEVRVECNCPACGHKFKLK